MINLFYKENSNRIENEHKYLNLKITICTIYICFKIMLVDLLISWFFPNSHRDLESLIHT